MNLVSETQQELNDLNQNLKNKVRIKTRESEYRFYHNPITNLRNEHSLYEKLKKSNSERVLIIIDIDNFNFYNEIYGPDEANGILKSFGEHLSQHLDKNTYDLYHLHSDQFAMLLKIDMSDEHTASSLITEIKYLIKEFKYYAANSDDIVTIEVTSKKAYEFVKSISQLSKALGVKTIAEFVHSKEVFEVCQELGIDQFQGFYFYEPLEVAKIREIQTA